MPTTLDLSGLDKVQAGLRRIVNPNTADLEASWMLIIDEDNRKGVLAGLDKDGVPLAPVTYRPKDKRNPLKANKGQRAGMRPNVKKGAFLSRIGPWGGAGAGNLTTAEYQLLGGPPLAPRGQFSRVITNLRTGSIPMKNGILEVFGYWEEVVSVKSVPFLPFHFNGIGQKRRDLRGVRPEGVAKAVVALGNWARLLVRQAFGRAA